MLTNSTQDGQPGRVINDDEETLNRLEDGWYKPKTPQPSETAPRAQVPIERPDTSSTTTYKERQMASLASESKHPKLAR